MTVQAGSNKWFSTKEGNNMGTFKNHIESMRGFRRSHTNVQNVAVVERDSLEKHDEQMKAFRRSNHPDISELRAVNTGGAQRFLNLAEWAALIPNGNVTEHRFSLN